LSIFTTLQFGKGDAVDNSMMLARLLNDGGETNIQSPPQGASNMMSQDHNRPVSHAKLADYTAVIGVGIQFAFQPLVDLEASRIIGYEALVRGRSGEPASSIIANVLPENLGYFDQACRSRAIQDAAELGIRSDLFLNCTQVGPDDLGLALSATADQLALSSLEPGQLVLEFSSLARLGNPRELAAVRERANGHGFRVLADNFGTGEAGLKRLAVFRPEFVKLDREIINQVHASQRRQAMIMGIVATCRALGSEVIATGVEHAAEVEWLHDKAGVHLFQGYYFARPQLQAKPAVERELLEA
jgi:blue light- and temperature-responsive anti-repressor